MCLDVVERSKGLNHLFGYETSFELLIINALYTFVGLCCLSIGRKAPVESAA